MDIYHFRLLEQGFLGLQFETDQEGCLHCSSQGGHMQGKW